MRPAGRFASSSDDEPGESVDQLIGVVRERSIAANSARSCSAIHVATPATSASRVRNQFEVDPWAARPLVDARVGEGADALLADKFDGGIRGPVRG